MARHMRSHEIRRRFVDHFTATGHVQLPSGSLVPPAWDKSVLITTAGMQPLKQLLPRARGAAGARLVTVQKCFRTVDIDEVGRTAHHLTFFEMLGNFSIGDYFKRLRRRAGVGARHLAATASASTPTGCGRRSTGATRTCPADEEAVELWLERRRAAPSGSCGSAATTSGRPARSARAAPAPSCTTTAAPSSAAAAPECGPDCDCDRFIEFWNLVFMQYNMLDDGSLEPLPAAEHRHRRRASSG